MTSPISSPTAITLHPTRPPFIRSSRFPLQSASILSKKVSLDPASPVWISYERPEIPAMVKFVHQQEQKDEEQRKEEMKKTTAEAWMTEKVGRWELTECGGRWWSMPGSCSNYML